MAKDYDKEDGVWRTIGGRKVFIRKGQNLADAMIESGKFKGQKNKSGMRESYRKEKEKDLQEAKDLAKKFQESETDKDYYAFLNKVEDNGEKYDKTLEEREKEKQRNDEIDKQRGTEPLREKYREEGKEDLEKEKDWRGYRNRYQKTINRSSNPDNREKYVQERDMAQKEIDKARNNLNQKADEILSQKDKSIKNVDDNVPEDIKKRGLTDRYLEKKKQMEEWLEETNSGKLSKAEEEALEYQREKHGEEAYQKALAETKKGDDTFKKATNPNNDSNKNNNLKKLEEDTRDLSDYDKYNLAVSKLENKENMSSDERHFWNRAKMDYERKQKELENTDAKKLMGAKIENGKRVAEYRILGDDERGYWTKENGQRVFKENPRYKDKSTNETMNNVIREKASKKTWRDDLREANEKTTQELIDENTNLYKEYGGFADTGDKQKNQEVEKAHAKWLQNKTLIQEHEKQGNNYRNALTKLNDKSIKDGTYDLDTSEAVDFKGVGYNVSFEQTGDNYTNGEYYDKINECRNKCDGKVYGGKFDGTPELSFYTKNIDDAIEVAEKYNQHSVWDIEINDYYYNPFYDESKNKVGIKAQENDDWVRRSFDIYKREHPNTKINSIKDYLKMKKKK